MAAETDTVRNGSKIALLGGMLMLASCAPTLASAQTVPPTSSASAALDAGGAAMTMEQTLSDQAQLTTIAFDGLAFRGFQAFREFRVPSVSRFNVLRVPKVLCNW